MKKIKLVISDLHLSAGKTLEDGTTNPLEEFFFDVKFKEFLHYYTTGEYKDTEVELIINGDFLNFIQMDYNGHYLTVITEAICLEKLKKIIHGHPDFFEALKDFLSDPKHSLTYIIGNHDQAMLWKKTRAYLNDYLQAEVNFKNIVYFFDGVHIEHGHMYETANRVNPKKFFLKKNLAEPILNLPFGSHFFIEFVMRLKLENPNVDKVRPFGNFVKWGLAFDFLFSIKAMFSLTKYFLHALLFPDPRRGWSAKQLMKIFFEGAVFPDLGTAAKKILRDDRVNMVVFGHSHVYQYRQWGKKEYFNTGTWTDVTSLDMASLGKITKLTYVLFDYIEYSKPYTDNEGEEKVEVGHRPRGRLKEWRGYHRIEEDVVVS